MFCGHSPLVSVPRMVIVTLVPLHVSEADGGSKLQAAPQSTVLLPAQVMTGAVVSTIVTVWLHVLVLPQASVASQVRVMVCGHSPLVSVPRMVTVTLVLPHESRLEGESKLQDEEHSTVLLEAQVRTR